MPSKSSLEKPDIGRLITAMTGGIPDRVPLYEILVEARNVKHYLGKDIGSTMAASRGSSDSAFVSPPMDPKDFLRLCQLTHQDAMTLEALWTPVKYRDTDGSLHIVNDGRIKDWNALEQAVLPSDEHDLEPRRKIIRDYVRTAKGTGVGVGFVVGAFFQCCYYFLCEFNEFLLKFYEDPKFVEALMDICVDYYIKIEEIAIEEGVDFIFLADDIAFKSGTFVEPEMFKSFWLPRAKRILEPARAAGKPIMFHSCGNVTNVMDSIIMEIGTNCLNPIEPYSMDIYDIKRRYGDRLALSGNIDIAGPLAFGTPAEVRAEVIEHLDALKPGGGYIMSTNHSVMDDIPPQNYETMIQTTLELGVY